MEKQKRNWILFWVYVIVVSTAITIASSCSSRKVNIANSNIKIDSVSTIKDTVSIKVTDNSNIKKYISSEEIIIRPLDSCVDFIVNGKLYKNVIITIKKHSDNSLYSKEKTLDLKASKMQNNRIVKTVIAKVKQIDKQSSVKIYYIFWILFFIILFFAYKYINRLRLKNIFSA
jgi:hypothetical protein